MTTSVVPVAGVQAHQLVAILHDAEEDDDRIRAAIDDPSCTTYAALVDGRPVAAAVVRWAEPSEIVYVAVAAGERGRGHGRRIVAAIQAELPDHGRALIVGTANSSLDNIAFYQKCGFRMHAVRPDAFAYIQPPISEGGIAMRDMIVFAYQPDPRPRLAVRVARQTRRLAEVVAFYRDGLGLPEIGRFAGHDGYDGVMIDLPGTGAHLEFTATGHVAPPEPHVEQLLVLYLGDRRAVDEAVARCGARPVASANPYWDRVGVTVADPDGFRVVLVAGVWPD